MKRRDFFRFAALGRSSWGAFSVNALKSLLLNGLDILYPPMCACCGELLPERFDRRSSTQEEFLSLCHGCLNSWIPHEETPCLKCGAFITSRDSPSFEEPLYDDFYNMFPDRESNGEMTAKCPGCPVRDFHFERVIPLGEYDAALRMAILQMKTDKSGLLATHTASLLFRCHAAKLCELEIDMVVPVPMHVLRRFVRGVNCPEFLAMELGRHLKRPVLRKIVRRNRATHPQFNLKPTERYKNVRGAFSLSGKMAIEKISNKTILLVDDILTTGSTCNEISKLLLENGAKKVAVCVLGRSVVKK